MSRVQLREEIDTVVGHLLGVIDGATVNVYLAGTSTPATVYQAETGGATFPQPLTSVSGRVEAAGFPGEPLWVEEADLDVSGTFVPLNGGDPVTFGPIRVNALTADKAARYRLIRDVRQPIGILTGAVPGDDTAATHNVDVIRAHIEDLATTVDGGVLWLDGLYSINAELTLRRRVNLYGVGGQYDEGSSLSSNGRSGLRLASGSNCQMLVNDPAAPIRPGQDSLHRWQQSVISNVTFDGNWSVNTSGQHDAIRLTKAWSVTLENVAVYSATGYGIYLDDCNEVKITGASTVLGNMQGAVYWYSCADCTMSGAQLGSGRTSVFTMDQCNNNLVVNTMAFNANVIYGTLNSSVDASQTSVVFTRATGLGGLPHSGKLTIGTERISYTSRVQSGTGSNTFTLGGVTRGVDGTTPAAHTAGDRVQEYTAQGNGIRMIGCIGNSLVNCRADQNYAQDLYMDSACEANEVGVEIHLPGWNNTTPQSCAYIDADDTLLTGACQYATYAAEVPAHAAAVEWGPNAGGNLCLMAIDEAFPTRFTWNGSSHDANTVYDGVGRALDAFNVRLGVLPAAGGHVSAGGIEFGDATRQIYRLALATAGIETNGFFRHLRAAATDLALGTYVSGEAVNRLVVTADGEHRWSDGALAADSTLKRESGTMTFLGKPFRFQRAATTDQAIQAYITGEANVRFVVLADGSIKIGDGATAQDVTVARPGANRLAVTGAEVEVGTVGRGLRVKEGSNAKQGVATLVAGTVTVANTSVTANSRIILTGQDNNVTGALRVSARTAGTSFTITSSVGTDSGVVAYEIFEPA